MTCSARWGLLLLIPTLDILFILLDQSLSLSLSSIILPILEVCVARQEKRLIVDAEELSVHGFRRN